MITLSTRTPLSFKSIFSVVCMSLFLSGVFSSNALALTPEETLSELVRELKSSRDLTILSEYVDWSEAFNRMKPRVRKSIGVSSARGLRRHYTSMLQANGSGILERLKNQVRDKADEGEKYDATELDQATLEYEMQKVKLEKDISEMKFNIGTARLKDKSAMVQVTRTLNGEEKKTRVKMIKSGKKWKADSVEIFNPVFSPYSTPVGGVLDPSIAIRKL